MSEASSAPYPVPYFVTSGQNRRPAAVEAPRTHTISDHDLNNGETTVRTTIERVGNFVITTIIKIAPAYSGRVNPVTSGNDPAVRAQQQAEQAQDRAYDITPPFSNVIGPAGVVTTSVVYSTDIPAPRTLEPRSGMQFNNRFYVIYRGKEVGIFYDYHSEVAPRTLGVSNALMKAYDTWEDAITEYARAYSGLKPGHELAVIGNPNLGVAGPSGEDWQAIDDAASSIDAVSSADTVYSVDTVSSVETASTTEPNVA